MGAELPKGYKPSKTEEFMNPLQIAYFKKKLLDWRNELLRESEEAIHHLQEESRQQPDSLDLATIETDQALELRRRDRQRKLISKIDEALNRIEDGSYGYCEETGEPINLERLEARPNATMSIEAQERHERYERSHSEDADE